MRDMLHYGMQLDRHFVDQLRKIYLLKKKEIVSRLSEFEQYWTDKNDEEIFTELSFCILTPQSRAKSCWEAITALRDKDLLLKGNVDRIREKLHCVRFHNKKAQYLVDARGLFIKNGRISIKQLLGKFMDVYERREWLVRNIRGLGYKEASHFLRNLGFGKDIAILDRHILKNLKLMGVIKEIPESIGRSKYLEIEKSMAGFAKDIGIPLAHLDLLLWSKETGEIFK
jgi:N-glycosylase/DNA lyase